MRILTSDEQGLATEALRVYAELKRREANRRSNAGPGLAGLRWRLRDEERRARLLAMQFQGATGVALAEREEG